MKQWRYAWGWKAAAVVINQICAVVMVLSLFLCMLYVGSGGIGLLRQDENFEDTEYYQTEVREQIYRCIRAASRESKFESGGVYDKDILVNLEDYVTNNRILDAADTKTGLYYKLTDLLSWAEEGITTGELLRIEYQDGRVDYTMQDGYIQTVTNTYDENGDVISSSSVVRSGSLDGGTRVYAEEGLDAESEEVMDISEVLGLGSESAVAYELVTEEVDAYLNNTADSTILQMETLEAVGERYAPVGYGSLIEYAQKNKLTGSELQGLYHDLQETITTIYNDYYAYVENLELFSPSMTNMRYMIIPAAVKGLTAENFNELTFTNLKAVPAELEGTEAFLEYFRSYPDYMIYNTADMGFESQKMPLSIGDISNYLKGYGPSVEGDYIVAIAVDPAYQASDNLQAYKLQFEQLRPISEWAFYGLFLGLVLYFLTLVYLTLAAGHRSTSERSVIHLNLFDRIKTEIAAAIVVAPAVGLVFLAYRVLRRIPASGLWQYALIGGAFLFLLNALFLCGYLSLARRVKGRNIWTNSVFYMILRFLNTVIANRKMTTRTILEYLLFLAANCVLLLFDLEGFLAACVMDAIVGVVLLNRAVERQKVLDGICKITEGELDYQIPTDEMHSDTKVFAEAVNRVGEGLAQAVAQGVKDEKLKSDLITNVSHDIKTPLTSIINYVDLLKREDIPNEKARSYIKILEEKSHRLKHLTEDLVEASKISSGNVTLEFIRINFQELIQQTNGEFYERFEAKGLRVVTNMPEEPVVIEADGRRLWRIIENVYSNVAKYAMPNTRVYVDMTVVGRMVRLNVKNISEQPLNIEASQLTERFIRGDVSRSSEGSGLGLSIARNLTELQKGSFEIYLDGDLFRVTIIFPLAPAGSHESEEVLREETVAPEEAEGLVGREEE